MTTFETSFNENNYKKGQKIIIAFNPNNQKESVAIPIFRQGLRPGPRPATRSYNSGWPTGG